MKSVSRAGAARLKYIRKLALKKYRRSEGRFLIEGMRLVEEALTSDWAVELLIVRSGWKARNESKRLLAAAGAKHPEVTELSSPEFDSLAGTETPQGVLALVREKRTEPDEFLAGLTRPSLVLALDGVADPGNAGTILRVADWFGAAGVMLGGDSVELFNPKVLRASMGAFFHIPVVEGVDIGAAASALRTKGWLIAVTSPQGGRSLSALRHPGSTLLVLGSEARGVSGGILSGADVVLTIPGYGRAESLNVASSAAVLLAAWRGCFEV
jgi:TrmH family RNA methyltransferase